ncbi:hypothetical protein MYU51_000535 [Penicillium brevicompactum]
MFTLSISSLLETLSFWPSTGNNSTSLELYSRSPSDWRACEDWAERRTRHQTAIAFPEEELLDKRWEGSYLDLTERIPFTAGCIHSFKIPGHPGYRHFAPSAISEIVSLLPQVEKVDMVLHDDEKNDSVLRDRLRGGKPSSSSRSPLQLSFQYSIFCSSLGEPLNTFRAVKSNDASIGLNFKGWPQSLRCLDLSYPGPTPSDDETLDPPPRSASGKDILSLALHKLSHQLKSIDLRNIMIGPELFWPAIANQCIPMWPNLTTFVMDYQPATTSGEWLFENDPAWDEKVDEPWSPSETPISPGRFRTLPNAKLDELYCAAAQAAQRMPRLRCMRLEAGIGRSWIKESFGPPVHTFEYNAIRGQAIWTSSSEYHLAGHVRSAWDAVAKSHGHAEVYSEVCCANF